MIHSLDFSDKHQQILEVILEMKNIDFTMFLVAWTNKTMNCIFMQNRVNMFREKNEN